MISHVSPRARSAFSYNEKQTFIRRNSTMKKKKKIKKNERNEFMYARDGKYLAGNRMHWTFSFYFYSTHVHTNRWLRGTTRLTPVKIRIDALSMLHLRFFFFFFFFFIYRYWSPDAGTKYWRKRLFLFVKLYASSGIISQRFLLALSEFYNLRKAESKATWFVLIQPHPETKIYKPSFCFDAGCDFTYPVSQ